MSRHRNLRDIIDEAYDDYNEEDAHEDEEFNEEDEDLINYVWDEVGEDYTKDEILEGLNQTDWEPIQAINFLKKKGSKKKKSMQKQTKAPEKTTITTKPQQVPVKSEKPANEVVVNVVKEEIKEQLPTLEFKTSSRKSSEDAIIPKVEPSIYIDKTKFNLAYQDVKYDLPGLAVESLTTLHAVVIGHVDSGKSTLVGHLLYLLGKVDKALMHKYEKESQNIGKSSFKYAWIMDEREEERKRGITIDVGVKTIETKHKKIVLLDAPGHKDYVPNMISGAAQADIAILVIDSVINAFEGGFTNGGQSQEHAILAKSMGIDNIIVAVNKIDAVSYNKSRYETILNTVIPFLQDIGFEENKIHCLPISGMLGENIDKRSKNKELSWYKGPSLLELLDEIKLPPKNFNKPFRMTISNVYQATTGKIKGNCLVGKIEGGIIQKNTKYLIMPLGIVTTAKEIFIDDQKRDFAKMGENVTVVLSKETDTTLLTAGQILSSMQHPIPVAVKFKANIEAFDNDFPIIKGQRVHLHIGLSKMSAIIIKIEGIIHKASGDILKKTPKCIKTGQCALIEILCERKFCMENFKNFSIYGRITLREKGSTIAAGIITEIIEQSFFKKKNKQIKIKYLTVINGFIN